MLPSPLFEYSNGNVCFSDSACQYIEELNERLVKPLYTDDELHSLPSNSVVDFREPGPSNCVADVCGDDGDDDGDIDFRMKSKKRKRCMIDESDDDDNDDKSVAEFVTGEWVVSRFEFAGKINTAIKLVNFYVGQIIPADDEQQEDEVKIQEDEVKIQFYRSQIPCEHIYIQLSSHEYAKKDTIVEKIGKPEILSGGRIKLVSLPNKKLV